MQPTAHAVGGVSAHEQAPKGRKKFYTYECIGWLQVRLARREIHVAKNKQRRQNPNHGAHFPKLPSSHLH